MAIYYKPGQSKKAPPKAVEVELEQYNHDGDSIGYVDGKICFVQGGLPGERVKVQLSQDKSKVKKGKVIKLLRPLEQRIDATCRHFGDCGGCQLQHIDRQLQMGFKTQAVDALFRRFAKLDSLPWQTPLTAEPWHYRRAARIGIWYERKLGQYTVGFRRRNDKVLTEVQHCAVLSKAFEPVFTVFAELLPQLKSGPFMTHLEVVAADEANLVVIRHTKAVGAEDRAKLAQLAKQYHWHLALEGDKGQIEPLSAGAAIPELFYRLPDGIELQFNVGDFIQVNGDINRQMIAQAIDWLALDPSDTVLDLFCGIGNFSLPLAKRCHKVVGVEGVDKMVERASNNAKRNQLENAEFYQADLSADLGKKPPSWLTQTYDKVLLDPARAGAEAIMPYIAKRKIKKVLYVSCDPFTLARDSAALIDKGYQLKKIALMDMFSHTRHVEVMALFER